MNRVRLTRRTAAAALLAGVAVILLLAWQWSRSQPAAPQPVPISQALAMVEQGQVKRAVIMGNVIVLTDAQGHQYRAVKEDGSTVAEMMRQQGVQVEKSDRSHVVL